MLEILENTHKKILESHEKPLTVSRMQFGDNSSSSSSRNSSSISSDIVRELFSFVIRLSIHTHR